MTKLEKQKTSLAQREAAALVTEPNEDVVKAFRALLAAYDRADINNTIEYKLPCGSGFKIVCLGTARNQIAMAEAKKDRNACSHCREGAEKKS